MNITALDYHRNGCGGHGFYVALFTDKEVGQGVATVFCEDDGEGYTDRKATLEACRISVFSVPELAAGNIAFARGNSWRGDHYIGPIVDEICKRDEASRAETAAWLATDAGKAYLAKQGRAP